MGALRRLRTRVATAFFTQYLATVMRSSSVSATNRPPRRCLPRPNCHSHSLISCMLLLFLPDSSAATASPCENLLCWRSWCGMIGVGLPRRNRGIKGTRPRTSAARPTHTECAWVRAQTASARPGQGHGLEGASEHELDLRVIGPSWQPAPIGRRWQEKKQLRPDHPTLVEGSIGGFPHHVWIWGDSEHKILRNKLKSWISVSKLYDAYDIPGIYVINCGYDIGKMSSMSYPCHIYFSKYIYLDIPGISEIKKIAFGGKGGTLVGWVGRGGQFSRGGSPGLGPRFRRWRRQPLAIAAARDHLPRPLLSQTRPLG